MSGFSASSAFKSAKTFADKGHAQIQQGFKQLDSRVPIGSQKRTDSSSAPPGGASSPGLATYSNPAPPPPPPTRTATGAAGPPPPPGRGRAGSAASSSYAAPANASGPAGKGVFSGMDQREKEAFFALLDEYFSSRPQFASLFQGAGGAAPPPAAQAPAPPAASRPTPAPPAYPVGLGTAVALYAYEGGQAEDLSFAEGERITVLEIVSDDWMKGELNGRKGIFPSAYVQMQG
ncbi:hypothetical protein JCM3775_000336 [Rhodotorula graminis]|uniref:SH3 domain-containing protein n=1 Tax=Rhodotorula graminis (strain WP1) TaxID=578459 RepID=A0A194S930_RHOGW|nr:uncharacterized protein RHOBADRAFT_42452 [Rhodotorula graminis WP1]KPV77238.1 hypothetical protein RHOBADRAFT_42452 [Rhodotorula graminis WP1]